MSESMMPRESKIGKYNQGQRDNFESSERKVIHHTRDSLWVSVYFSVETLQVG
jgi:hypothetical protein